MVLSISVPFGQLIDRCSSTLDISHCWQPGSYVLAVVPATELAQRLATEVLLDTQLE